jgi:hypothetical protein
MATRDPNKRLEISLVPVHLTVHFNSFSSIPIAVSDFASLSLKPHIAEV